MPIDEYQAHLATLRTSLERRLDDPSETDELAKDAKAAQSAFKSMLQRVEAQGNWAPTLERILWPPIDLVWKLTEKGVAGDVANKWCGEVQEVFETKIAGRYPFKANSGVDVPMGDFAAYFDPEKGTLWQFYDAVLKTAVIPKGDKYVLAKRGSRTLGRFRPSVANYLSAANALSLSMFTRGLELGVDFDVLIEGAPQLKEVVLTIDGQVVRHRNGPENWTTVTWPGEGDHGAKLEGRAFGVEADLIHEGDWGLFRLLEEGVQRVSSDRRSFTVQWDMGDERAGLVQIRFRPSSGTSPFFGPQGSRDFLKVFRSKALRVPRSIMVDGPGCGKD